MKKALILFSLLIPFVFAIGEEAMRGSEILAKFKADAAEFGLVHCDFYWDGGSRVYEIAYKGDFEGERSLFVYNVFRRTEAWPVFVTEKEGYFKGEYSEKISTQNDKAFLISILETIEKEYPQVGITVLNLKGEFPPKEPEGYKIPPRMQKKIDGLLEKIMEKDSDQD